MASFSLSFGVAEILPHSRSFLKIFFWCFFFFFWKTFIEDVITWWFSFLPCNDDTLLEISCVLVSDLMVLTRIRAPYLTWIEHLLNSISKRWSIKCLEKKHWGWIHGTSIVAIQWTPKDFEKVILSLSIFIQATMLYSRSWKNDDVI